MAISWSDKSRRFTVDGILEMRRVLDALKDGQSCSSNYSGHFSTKYHTNNSGQNVSVQTSCNSDSYMCPGQCSSEYSSDKNNYHDGYVSSQYVTNGTGSGGSDRTTGCDIHNEDLH